MSDTTTGDELRDEYQFDYAQAKPNRFAAAAKAAGRPGAGRPPGEGGRGTGESLRKLREAAAAFARDREAAEAKVAQINPTLDRLRNVRMLAPDHTVIGPVIHSVDHDDAQMARYYAAGIRGDAGIGVFAYTLGFGESPDHLTNYDFMPFAGCPPVVQARLAGQIDGLLARLMADLHVSA